MLADNHSKESDFVKYCEGEPFSRKMMRIEKDNNEYEDAVKPLRFSLKNSSCKIVDESFYDNADISVSSATVYKLRNQSQDMNLNPL